MPDGQIVPDTQTISYRVAAGKLVVVTIDARIERCGRAPRRGRGSALLR